MAVSKFENTDCIPNENFSSCIINVKEVNEKLKVIEILNPSYNFQFIIFLQEDRFSKS